MQERFIQPASAQYGRPSPSLTRNIRRTTVYSLPVSTIPIGLLILLIIIAAWSWSVLRPELSASFLQSGVQNTMANDPLLSSAAISEADIHDGNSLSSNFSPQVLFWSDEILEWSHEYHLDPNLIALVMQIESCGYAQAHSHAGALGLFQVMPFHFGHDENPYDPATNATRGLSYLARSMELANGRLDLALAGYNGGHLMIQNAPSLWPEETQRYVYWGVQIYNELGKYDAIPPTLQEWLDAGGEQLCKKAANAQSY
jgi:soluble lytic murein transglycosylase-like protein